LLRSDLRVQLRVVDHVVAVGAPLARPEEGRGVDVGDAQRVEVGDDRGRVTEAEPGMELEPVGRRRTRGPGAVERTPQQIGAPSDLAAGRARGNGAGAGVALRANALGHEAVWTSKLAL